MNAFLTHVLINNTDNSDHQLCNFILDGLTDYDKMKVVLEQAIYYSYLKVTTGDNSVVEDISKSVHSMYLQLKDLSILKTKFTMIFISLVWKPSAVFSMIN